MFHSDICSLTMKGEPHAGSGIQGTKNMAPLTHDLGPDSWQRGSSAEVHMFKSRWGGAH